MDRLAANRQRTTNALLSGENFLQSWKVYRNEIRKKCSQGQGESSGQTKNLKTLNATELLKELQQVNGRAVSPMRSTRTEENRFFSPLRHSPTKEYDPQGSPTLDLSQPSPRRERSGAHVTVNLRDIYKLQDAVQACENGTDLSTKCAVELKSLSKMINKLLN